MSIVDISCLYRHYKGGLYRPLAEATHSETLEPVIVYQSEENGTVWVRPASMWHELVSIDGQDTPRFLKVEND